MSVRTEVIYVCVTQGIVPMDLMPEMADRCSHNLAKHFGIQSFAPSLPPCPDLQQPLDLRDCDSSQGGHLNPSTCIQILHDAYPPEVVLSSEFCTFSLCPSGYYQMKRCVEAQLTTIPNHACVPNHLLDNLVYAGVAPKQHFTRQINYVHIYKQSMGKPLAPRIQDLVQRGAKLEQYLEPCLPMQEPDIAPSASPSEHRCWNMSKEGPKPGVSCLQRPLWLPPQVPPTTTTGSCWPF